MNDFVPFSLRLLATSDYRNLPPIDKAIKLREDEKLSYRTVVKSTDVTLPSLQRAEKARAEGRELGVNGRPNVLNKAAMECFIDLVNSFIDMREEINYDTAKQLVCNRNSLTYSNINLK
jgi:hypothetical protein